MAVLCEMVLLAAECKVANSATEILNRACTHDGDYPEQRSDQVQLDT